MVIRVIGGLTPTLTLNMGSEHEHVIQHIYEDPVNIRSILPTITNRYLANVSSSNMMIVRGSRPKPIDWLKFKAPDIAEEEE